MRKVPSPSRGRLMPWVCRCSIVTPERLKDRRINNRRCRVNGRFVGRMGEEGWVRQRINRLIVCAARSSNQDRVRMVKALRRWLEANELFAIVTGVIGALVVLSILLV